ncbi:arsenate reductase (glutaredoxin) [Brevundimonas aveniformis]|uniref:arsenate reductase (glutaredoxin) n=1 Tax=Brevundimonas aveniformis TaxID=370977 RepID=UPI002492460C|nr:arsenate reductase (glutaredoxin) [Brevundimonas aveniformis]
MSQVTIYHNPKCSTSRKALEMIRGTGIEPEVVLYKETGWTADQIKALADRAGVPVSTLLRAKEPLAHDLGLTAPDISEAALLKAMVEHPVLVERPIVASDKGVVLGRPVERVKEILPT